MLLPVYINTYPAPENYFYIYTYLIPLRAGEAWEIFKNIFPAPEKYLYTLFRRRRSAYIHLSGDGEAGEAGEVFVYTPAGVNFLFDSFGVNSRYMRIVQNPVLLFHPIFFHSL